MGQCFGKGDVNSEGLNEKCKTTNNGNAKEPAKLTSNSLIDNKTTAKRDFQKTHTSNSEEKKENQEEPLEKKDYPPCESNTTSELKERREGKEEMTQPLPKKTNISNIPLCESNLDYEDVTRSDDKNKNIEPNKFEEVNEEVTLKSKKKYEIVKEEEIQEARPKMQRVNTNNLAESNVFYEDVEKDLGAPNIIEEEVEDEDLEKTVKIRKNKHNK